MHNQPLQIMSWPQAILHVDGDCFFASVEQSLNSKYRDKPLVTGVERGIASSMSKEAKKMGITRGMPIALVKRNFPDCIVVPGNYEAYMAFANRMFAILRRYTPIVEEYSIDEAFADISGLRRYFNKSYCEIGQAIQTEIESNLDLTVSVGISLTKSLAKLCSKFRKPHGLTCVKGPHIHILLQNTRIDKVWGIGKQTTDFLVKRCCYTAYDFVSKPLSFITRELTKRELEIYQELRGQAVFVVDPKPKTSYKSISKGRTFEPTQNREQIFAQLTKNIEDATVKCRKYKLAPKKIVIILKTQQFTHFGQGATLNRPTNNTLEIIATARQLFLDCYRPATTFRSTLCLLNDLVPDTRQQLTLFEDPLAIIKQENLSSAIDTINRNYGYGTIHTAASSQARKHEKREFSIPKLESVF